MRTPLRRGLPALPVVALLAASLPPPALACSTCKCGDYSITLFGVEKPFENRFRAALDTLYRSESRGEPGVAGRETDEWRTQLGFAWSPSQDWIFAGLIPYVRKEIEDTNLARLEASGLGDIDLIGRWVAFRSGGGSGRHLAGVRFGVRLPTAEEVEEGGEPLDIDVQPDAGATAPNLGGWYSYFRYPWMVATTATYFAYGGGRQDFSPGDAAVASVLGQYALNQTFAVQLGADARYAEKNRASGVRDDDSGGFLTMASAGVAARMSSDIVGSVGVQLPLLDDLNGDQDEGTTLRASIAYDF